MSTRKGRVEFEDDNGRMVRYDRHANGGGLVSPDARASAEAEIARTAYVEAGATVGDRTRIGAWSWIDRDVAVGSDVVVGTHVHVGRGSRVGSRARIGSRARLGAGVVVEIGARIEEDQIIDDHAVVPGRRRTRRGDQGLAA